MRIAVISNATEKHDLIESAAKISGHTCAHYSAGEVFLKDLRNETFDLVAVAQRLADTRGIELIETIRNRGGAALPLMLIAPLQDEDVIVAGLRAGADDCVEVRTPVREISARITSLLRRAYPESTLEQCLWSPYHFDPARNTVAIENLQKVTLTPKEFGLALLLFRNHGRVLSRRYLLESLWPVSNPPDTLLMSQSLDTHISRIRKLLHLKKDSNWYLKAMYGRGYRLDFSPLND